MDAHPPCDPAPLGRWVQVGRRALAALAGALLLGASPAGALVHAVGDASLREVPPDDDPGWASVGRRLGGPTVVYLGNGWGITAAHVGAGVVVIGGQRYDSISSSYTKLHNRDGTSADLMLFRIDPGEHGLPDLPILPIRTAPPQPDEELVLIGVGNVRSEPVEATDANGKPHRGFSVKGTDRLHWGTNRAAGWPTDVHMGEETNRSIPMVFLPPDHPMATEHEAQAAMGDSGGAVFARRNPNDPSQGWALAGILSNVSSVVPLPTPGKPRAAYFGDVTMAVDLSYYRDQIIPLVRPACSNELDDDGDGRIDHPHDRGCSDMADQTEDSEGHHRGLPTPIVLALGAVAMVSIFLVWAIFRLRRDGDAPAR